MRDLVTCQKCGNPTGNKASWICDQCKVRGKKQKSASKADKTKIAEADRISASFIWTIINDFKPPQEWDADSMQAVRRDLRRRFINYGRSVQEGDFKDAPSLPKEFVEERIDEGRKLTIFGKPLSELSRKELLAATVYSFQNFTINTSDYEDKTGE